MDKRLLKRILLIFVVVYAFLLSVRLIGVSALLGSSSLSGIVGVLEQNPFLALFVGVLLASICQTSSLVIPVVVAFSAGGVLPISTSIIMIMGSCVGASVSNVVSAMSHAHRKAAFKDTLHSALSHDFLGIFAVVLLFPIEINYHIIEKAAVWLSSLLIVNGNSILSRPFAYIIVPVSEGIQYIIGNSWLIGILGVVLMVLSVEYYVNTVSNYVRSMFHIAVKKKKMHDHGNSFLHGLLHGSLHQSNSVSSSIAIPHSGGGVLHPSHIYHYLMGSGVGHSLIGVVASLSLLNPVGLTVGLANVVFHAISAVVFAVLREIPLTWSDIVSRAIHRRVHYPVAYIAAVFYVIPLVVIGITL